MPLDPWTLGLSVTREFMGDPRIEATVPCDIRLADYPDGSRRVQGAYVWVQGSEGGVLWRDLPLVQVDEHGQERR